MTNLRSPSVLAALLAAAPLAAQSVLPPFDATYQVLTIPTGLGSYGGTAFAPGNPNVLLVGVYNSGVIQAVPLVRNGSGFITGAQTPIPVATVGGPDGGLAFGPGNVLFATWYGPNRLSQVKPGSTTADRVDDLFPLGLVASVGACAFVPTGMPGAGRFKVCTWSSSQFHEIPLTPDANGTFAPGAAGPAIQLDGGIEGLVYVPNGPALIGGTMLTTEYSSGQVSSYQIDANGNPLPATRQIVVGGSPGLGGGVVDPVTSDVIFLAGSGQLLILRNGAACGSFAGYGSASPGALGTPTIAGSGCARIGQTITIATTGPTNGIGLIAGGSYAFNTTYFNLNVLQPLQVTVLMILDGNGQGTLPLPIPLNPFLGNSHFYLQAAFLDASTTSGLIASAGLDVLIR